MNQDKPPASLSDRLLELDLPSQTADYAGYRAKLERAIQTARRREQIAFWMCVTSGAISFPLLFIGGSSVFGDFDPWSKNATPLSVALSAIFAVSSVTFWILLASYYSRFRPRTREAREKMRDLQWLQFEARLDSLQRDVDGLMQDRAKSQSNHESTK